MPFVWWYDENEDNRALWDMTLQYFERDVLKVYLSLILLCRQFRKFKLIDLPDY